MAETVIAVPAELLGGMADSMRDAVTVARDTAAALRALDAKVDTLTKALQDHAGREEPMLQTYADHLRKLTEADAEVTVDARSAAKRAEIAAAEAAAQAAAQRQQEATRRAEERAEARAMWVKIALGIASLIATALASAGATLALGGP